MNTNIEAIKEIPGREKIEAALEYFENLTEQSEDSSLKDLFPTEEGKKHVAALWELIGKVINNTGGSSTTASAIQVLAFGTYALGREAGLKEALQAQPVGQAA